ncbi:MAG: hypothetical protein WC091_24095 [Sulfuricellaceae bacterium]
MGTENVPTLLSCYFGNTSNFQEETMVKNISIFLVGLFAGICAVFVPRMVAMLNGGHADVQYWDPEYIMLGLAFSLIIGGVTVIFEQNKQKTAAETFMTALGIPALLAGALNSGYAGNNLGELQTVNQRLNESLAQKSNIPIEKGVTNVVPLEATPPNSYSPISRSGFSLISDAHAGDGPPTNEGLKLGIRVEQTPYLIVLKKFNTKEEALKSAAELRKMFPQATAVQSNQSFFVIEGNKPLSKSDALLKAIDLQSRTGVNPSLLQAK